MATGTCQAIMKSIDTTEILPWLQLSAVVIGGKNGAGALHTRTRPFSVRRTNSETTSAFHNKDRCNYISDKLSSMNNSARNERATRSRFWHHRVSLHTLVYANPED